MPDTTTGEWICSDRYDGVASGITIGIAFMVILSVVMNTGQIPLPLDVVHSNYNYNSSECTKKII
jgi:hypothetical protein